MNVINFEFYFELIITSVDFQHPVLKIQLKDIRNIIKRRFLLRQVVNIFCNSLFITCYIF